MMIKTLDVAYGHVGKAILSAVFFLRADRETIDFCRHAGLWMQ